MNVIFTGFKDLDTYNLKKSHDIIERGSKKLEKIYPDLITLRVQLKKYNLDGKTKKYSVLIKAELGKKAISVHTHAWDLVTACHKSVNDLRKELEKLFHKESSPWHRFRKKMFASFQGF